MKSEAVHVRLPEIYMWKLRSRAELRGTTAGRLAKIVLEDFIGEPTEEEMQRFRGIMMRMGREEELLDPVSAAVRQMRHRNLRRGAAPSMAESERKARGIPSEPDPRDVVDEEPHDFDSEGKPICPTCGTSTYRVIGSDEVRDSVQIIDGSKGWYHCHNQMCPDAKTGLCVYEGFIGQPNTVVD